MSQKPPNRPAARVPQQPARTSAPPASRPRPAQRPVSQAPSGRPVVRPAQGRSSRYAPPPPSSGINPMALIAIIGGVLLVAVLGILLLGTQPSSGSQTTATGAQPTSANALPAGTAASMDAAPASNSAPAANAPPPGTPIPGLTVVANLDRNHTSDPVTYPQVPPLGGPHWDKWQNCGVYAEPVKNEQAVHSLEHGAIWITYQPSLPADQIEALRKLTRQSDYRLLSPYPGLPHPIVVSAWGYQVPVDSPTDPRLYSFIANFQQNPNGPEPGASCSNSEGNPLP